MKKVADKKVVVDVDVRFFKCPKKKHRVETPVVVGGTFDGFIRPGCVCAAELLVEALKVEEKKKRKVKK